MPSNPTPSPSPKPNPNQVVDALNVHDIPTATDVIDSFNRDVRDNANPKPKPNPNPNPNS